jgi:conjugal transfer/type IV secretion protein DotA/TraY
MGEFQKDIYDAKAKVIYRGTNPDLQRMNREGVSSEKEKVMYNVLVRQMDMAINDYMKTPTVVTNLSTSDMENLIPEDLTSEDVSYKRIAADVEDANTTLVMKTMRVFIDTFVGSSATNNVDAITRMQTTGNVLHIVLTQLDGAISGLRIGLTVGGATGAVFSDNIGTAAQIAIGLVDYLSEKLAKIMVMGKLVAIYMAIIIPTLPYVFFLMAVIGWVLHILQAMTGLILWSIMHMIPDRTFVGSQMQGYLTVIALFFRPMLSLMGFYLAFMLSDPIITFTTDVFFTIMGATQFTSNGFIAALSQFFFLMAWVILYCTILLPIIF